MKRVVGWIVHPRSLQWNAGALCAFAIEAYRNGPWQAAPALAVLCLVVGAIAEVRWAHAVRDAVIDELTRPFQRIPGGFAPKAGWPPPPPRTCRKPS